MIHTSAEYVEGAPCRITARLVAPPWWSRPFHREYITDRFLVQAVPGTVRRYGPLCSVLGIWLLHLEDQLVFCRQAYWVLNPVTALAYPLWRLARLIRGYVLRRA